MTVSTLRMWFVACSTLPALAGAMRADEVPRYALKPGQVLTYNEDESFKSRNEDSRYRWARKLWVVGQNSDGSWRIVAREVLEDLGKEKAPASASQERPDYARFDLFPDGKVPPCPTLGLRIDPSHVFPRLPGSQEEASAGWTVRDDREGSTVRYEPISSKALEATFDFTADQSSFMERIYEGKDSRTFHFDRQRGLVVRAEIERAYGAHMQGTGTGTLELTSAEELGPSDLATFRAEMDRYFDAQQSYRAALRKVKTAGDDAEALIQKGRTVLTDARARVILPEPKAALDAIIENLNRSAKNHVDDAARFASLIGHPAPDGGKLDDLDGRPHSLEHYRGKVLVIDFWYRGCGWCMRAMPQVKMVARHYSGKPVAVFGMNNDPVADDAKFVVREMQLDYPVLRSQDLPAKYGVRGFPTLVIIDQTGKVADIHVGYSPRLYEEVTAAIDRLLETK